MKFKSLIKKQKICFKVNRYFDDDYKVNQWIILAVNFIKEHKDKPISFFLKVEIIKDFISSYLEHILSLNAKEKRKLTPVDLFSFKFYDEIGCAWKMLSNQEEYFFRRVMYEINKELVY